MAPPHFDAPTILALDIASRTGVCWGRLGDTPRFMTVPFTRGGEASSIDGCWEAASRVIIWASDFTRVEKIDRIVIEAPIPERALGHNTNAWATMLKMFMIGAMGGALKCRDIPVRDANIGAVRAFMLGRGNGHAKKEIAKPAVMRVCKALGWSPQDYDQADAGALWLYEGSRVAPLLVPHLDRISLGLDPVDPATAGKRR
jgi:hypothetical protein